MESISSQCRVHTPFADKLNFRTTLSKLYKQSLIRTWRIMFMMKFPISLKIINQQIVKVCFDKFAGLEGLDQEPCHCISWLAHCREGKPVKWSTNKLKRDKVSIWPGVLSLILYLASFIHVCIFKCVHTVHWRSIDITKAVWTLINPPFWTFSI